MTKEEFRTFQLAQLALLDEFKKICETNHLKYYLAAGTMLGAVRHKGFIPWDPDIDIIMPREDYENFLKIASKTLDQRFFLASYKTTKNHFNPHAKIYLNGTEIIYTDKNFRKHTKEHKGLYIDFAPLDRAPEDPKLQKKQAREIAFYEKLRYYKEGTVYNKGFLGYKVLGKAIIRAFMSIFPIRWINRKQDLAMQKYNHSPSSLVCDMPSKYPYAKMVLPAYIYGNPTPIIFEGREFTGPEKVDEYLKKYYGDYMKFPSKDELALILPIYEKVIYSTKS